MNPESGQESQSVSEAQRLTGVFHSPSSVFANIAQAGRWWIPLIIITIISIALVSAVQSRVTVDQMLAKALDNNERFQQLSAVRRKPRCRRSAKSSLRHVRRRRVRQRRHALRRRGALLFVFNLLMDGRLKYKNALNIYSYAIFPPASSVRPPCSCALPEAPDEFDMQNALAFNAGAFLATTASAWLKSLAGSIDLFTFWTIFCWPSASRARSRR